MLINLDLPKFFLNNCTFLGHGLDEVVQMDGAFLIHGLDEVVQMDGAFS